MPEALPPASTTRRGVDSSKFMGASFAAGKGLDKRVASNERKITILKNILKMRQQSQNIGDTLAGIQGSVDSIAETVDLQYKEDLQQKEEDRINDEQDEGKKREKGLEKVSSGVVKTAQKALAPVKSFMDKIGNFLKMVLMGAAVVKFLDWFNDNKNTDKAKNLFRFLKDWWPALVAIVLAFVAPTGTFIVGTIALLAWGIPKIIDAVKSIFGWQKDVDKNIEKNNQTIGQEMRSDVTNMEKDFDKKAGDLKRENDKNEKGGSDDAPELTDGGLKERVDAVQEPQEFNKGGFVNGPGGVDKVPAKLTAGEFVMSKGAVDHYGANTLAGMNAAAGGKNTGSPSRGFNEGGLIPNTLTTTSTSDGKSSFGMKRLTTEEAHRHVQDLGFPSMELWDGQVVPDFGKIGAAQIGPALQTARSIIAQMAPEKLGVFDQGMKEMDLDNPQGIASFIRREIPGTSEFVLGNMSDSINAATTPPGPRSTKAPKVKVIPIPPADTSSGGGVVPGGNTIPRFGSSIGGGTAKEQVLGIRR